MDSGTKEIGQCAGEEGDAMVGSGQYPEASRSVDSLGELRLVALLGDMIEAQGKAQAAETLGVSVRTLGRFEESRRLTRVLAAALETHLLKGGGSAADRQRRQAADAEERVAELEKALSEGLGAVRRESERAREEQARALAELERRVAALESAGSVSPSASVSGAAMAQPGNPAPAARPVVERPRRAYYDLVTAEAEPGEELVYGDAATAVIVKWREARDAVAGTKEGLDRLNARERRLELEIELIEEHKLTLPPATYPWDWGDRRQEVWRRQRSLDEVIVDRKMLRLRRFLTFGLWRK